MKATGIVRRIDDLGRVVIPKEIRRTLRIREGDPIEIFVRSDGEVVLKKYSTISEIPKLATGLAAVLGKFCDKPIAICDKDHVISCSGIPKREILERRVSADLEAAMNERKFTTEKIIKPIEGVDKQAVAVMPIVANSEVVGCAVVLSDEYAEIEESLKQLVQIACMLVEKELEE